MSFPSDEAALAVLEQHRLACAPVLSVVDTLKHPYFKARNLVRTVSDPILGEVTIPGFPLKFWPIPTCRSCKRPARAAWGPGAEGVSGLCGYGNRTATTERHAVSGGSVGRRPEPNITSVKAFAGRSARKRIESVALPERDPFLAPLRPLKQESSKR